MQSDCFAVRFFFIKLLSEKNSDAGRYCCDILLLKDDFDETFGGMETALVEVQRRGKAMMSTVTNLLLKTIFQNERSYNL